MSSLRTAGILLVTVPAIEFGGLSLLKFLTGRFPGYIVPPILMPAGFFLSVASPGSERPNRLIGLVPAGGIALAVGTVTLGVGLLTA